MIRKVLYFITLVTVVASDKWYDSEEDAIINYLLNGESFETDASSETLNESEPVLDGGLWKCGTCDNINKSKLIYSEVNQIDADMIDDKSVDIQESRLRWYGHVLRKPANYVGNKCLAIPPPPGPGRRGRPKKFGLDVVRADMRANDLTIRDAHDRAKWRRNSRKADNGPQNENFGRNRDRPRFIG